MGKCKIYCSKSSSCKCKKCCRGRDGATGPAGPQGATGPSGGPQGPQGLQGAVGVQGGLGAQGAQGDAGPQGVAGVAGTPGVQGAQGDVGPQGTAGAAGTPGVQGAQGDAGPQGTQGATGTNVADYAYVYNLAATTVPVETDIVFDTNGPISAGFTHTASTAPITIVNAGVYEATFVVAGDEASQFALFQNGVAVAGGIYGSGAGTQPNYGQVIFSAAAGDVITVRNHTSTVGTVTLSASTGGTQNNANASIVIKRLA